VTELPIHLPNLTVNPLSNDQYKTTLDVNQLIYNGGLINANAKLKEAQTKTQQQQVEVSIYQIKNKINQLYFQYSCFRKKQLFYCLNKTNYSLKLTRLKRV